MSVTMSVTKQSKHNTKRIRKLSALKLRFVTSYAGAIARGNTLLYLPRKLRNRIYTLTLAQTDCASAPFQDIEVPDTANLTFPETCSVDHIFRHEITELILNNSAITIPSDAAIYNLLVFLREHENGTGYALIRSVSFLTLDVLEKGAFAANATKLINKLPRLETVTLMIDLRHIKFVEIKEEGGEAGKVKVMDLEELARKYDFEGLVATVGLRKVVLALKPYLALVKKIRELAGQKGDGGIEEGLSGFWGLKAWIEGRAVEHGRSIMVCCPCSETVLGG